MKSLLAALFATTVIFTHTLCAQGSPSREELEAKFTAAMNGVTMSGRWALIKDGALGQERSEEYRIVSVAKTEGDNWVINARIKYQQVDIVAPIPIKVQWAGNTPVIVVDALTVPGGGTYNARVIIDGTTYAGTWSGGDHGGVLAGTIRKAE